MGRRKRSSRAAQQSEGAGGGEGGGAGGGTGEGEQGGAGLGQGGAAVSGPGGGQGGAPESNPAGVPEKSAGRRPRAGGVERRRRAGARAYRRRRTACEAPRMRLVDIVVGAVQRLGSQIGVSMKEIECFTAASGDVPLRKGSRSLLRYGVMRALKDGCLERTVGGLFRLTKGTKLHVKTEPFNIDPVLAARDMLSLLEDNMRETGESRDLWGPDGGLTAVKCESGGSVSIRRVKGSGGQEEEGKAVGRKEVTAGGRPGRGRDEGDAQRRGISPSRLDPDHMDVDDDLAEGDMEFPDKRFAPPPLRRDGEAGPSRTERRRDAEHGRAAAAALFVLASDIITIISQSTSVKLSRVEEARDEDGDDPQSRFRRGGGGRGGGKGGGSGFKGPHVDYYALGGGPRDEEGAEEGPAAVGSVAEAGLMVTQATRALSEIVSLLAGGAARVLDMSTSRGLNSESAELKEAIFQAFQLAALDIVRVAGGFVESKQDGNDGDESLGAPRRPNVIKDILGADCEPKLSPSCGGLGAGAGVLSLGCPSSTALSLGQAPRGALSCHHLPAHAQPAVEHLLQGLADHVRALEAKTVSNARR